MRTFFFLACVLLAVSFGSSLHAQDTTITYQGQLQQTGEPFTGTANLEFRLFNQLSGGSQVGTAQIRDDWPVADGLFQVELNFGAAAFGEQARYLEVRIEGNALSPRQAVRPSPTALFALTSGDSFWQQSGSGISYSDGNVGIGISPSAVTGLAVQSSTDYGIRGISSFITGIGVFGRASNVGGAGMGVRGEADASSGIGVSAANNSSSGGAALRARTNSPAGIAGWFEGPLGSKSFFQHGVGIGTTNPVAQLHVRADSSRPNPLRLYQSGGAIAMAVNSDGRVGIGTITPGTILDVVGTGNVIRATHSSGHRGILGDANGGVYGRRGGTGSTPQGWLGETNSGVRGFAGTGTWAGLFEGNVNVTGSLSKGGGSFKIDHPLDPENQYLFHSFVESPDMMNVYNGNVVTDHTGHAVVELPDYFEALNTDFRYQLTVIGIFAQAIVAEEIEGNVFVIATDQPDVKVSWQVTGIRDDAWARANRIEVEVPKPEQERGQYLHPEAFGVEVLK